MASVVRRWLPAAVALTVLLIAAVLILSTPGTTTPGPTRRLLDRAQRTDAGLDRALDGYAEPGPNRVEIGDRDVLRVLWDRRQRGDLGA